jgi:hypothetical protein
MRQRHIKASELRSFAFCERAWHFERMGVQSMLEKERAQGTIDHQEQGRVAVESQTASRLSGILLAIGIAGLVAAFLWWVLRS